MSRSIDVLRHTVRGVSVAAVLCLILTSQAQAQQGQPKTEVLRSETDGWPIHMTYWPATANSGGTENSAVVILIHGAGGDRLVWEQKGTGKTGKSFAQVLNGEGYAVISIDMRKHGESKKNETDVMLRPNDYRAMLGDLEAVKMFLQEEHQAKRLNMNKTAIVAADDMAPVAAAYAELDWKKKPHDDAPATSPGARTPRGQDIRALVFLSPSRTAGPINLLGPIKFLQNPKVGMSVLVAYGKQDPADKGTSKQVVQVMGSHPKNKDRVYLKDFPVKFRGTDLTAKRILVEVPMLQFLDQHLKQLDSEWRDRRSLLER